MLASFSHRNNNILINPNPSLYPHLSPSLSYPPHPVQTIEPELTKFDSVCGDGDCGIVMHKGASRVLAGSSTLTQTTRPH